jgi:hypothetical protein
MPKPPVGGLTGAVPGPTAALVERVVARPARQMRAHACPFHLLKLERCDDGFTSSACAVFVLVFMAFSLERIAFTGYFLFK